MSNKKITDLTELTTAADGDVVEIVDISDTTDNPAGSSKKISRTNFFKNLPTPSASTDAATKGYVDTSTFIQPHGSVSDWDTDVTNIRAAIAAGGEVRLGAGSFYLNTSDTELFLITSSKHIIGSGEQQTYLVLKDGLANTIDLFRIATAAVTEDIDIGGFTIMAQTTGSARGRHMFNIDATGDRVIWSKFHNIVFPNQGDIAGNDFYHYNVSGLYKFGNSWIYQNYIRNGIYATQLADDINVYQNHFEGNNIACNIVSMVAGSVNFYFYHNSAQVSNIVVSFNGLGAHIFQNSLEVIGGTPLAVVYLNGGTQEGGLYDWRSSIIDNKHIYAYANTHCHGIYLVGNRNTVIDGNYVTSDTSATTYKELYIDSSCSNIRVSRSNYFVNQQVSDSGNKMNVYGLAAGETGLFG